MKKLHLTTRVLVNQLQLTNSQILKAKTSSSSKLKKPYMAIRIWRLKMSLVRPMTELLLPSKNRPQLLHHLHL
ncbi:hypothetical protein D3C87_1690590 [compost metagenome]